MMNFKMGFDGELAKGVVSSGMCVECGACAAVCPHGCVTWSAGKPELCEECRLCGLCIKVCPKLCYSFLEVESRIFGRQRSGSEEFGVYQRVCKVRSADENVLRVCQDGGAVTTLLLYALEKRLIDGAVVSGLSARRPLFPVPRLAVRREDVLRCAGTRYVCSPNLLGLAEAAKRRVSRVAFVGTPCQVEALRRMQMSCVTVAAGVKLTLGLMCSECFQYEGLVEVLTGLGVDLADVEKVNIKGAMIVTLKSGFSKRVPLSIVKQHALKGCGLCGDFSSELADLSMGGLGLQGWTGVVVRTEAGENLLRSAEEAGAVEVESLREDELAFKLLVRLSKMKHQSKSCE